MIKLKRFITIFLSGLLCVTMVGCSNNSKENKDAEVRAEFQKAIDRYYEMTFENWSDNFEVSDPSLLSEEAKEKYSNNFKSVNYNGTTTYDNKKDESNKITDVRVSKEVATKTTSYIDGSNEVEKSYIPGDGYRYINKNGIKTKSRYFSSFYAIAYHDLKVEHVENLTMTKEGDKKIFKFNYKFTPNAPWILKWDSYLRTDSDIERKGISGTFIIDEKNNTIKNIVSKEYVDKKTCATAKGIYVGKFSNVNQEFKFPEDLDNYKMV